jgi:leucyl/phenylalanyl-tRNA---protein transferase
MPVYILSEALAFPAPHLASEEGLLAVGGDLGYERLLLAYKMGIFPWYGEGEPILWWSPDPRLVLYPKSLHVPKRLLRLIKQHRFRITMDTAFEVVITSCKQAPRENQQGTWIVDDMVAAYCRLHEAGYAHSVEAWQGDKLVGGLYGISLGNCFFGESMFSRRANASKVAFVTLVTHLGKKSFDLVDCQVATDHLIRFGAVKIPRHDFLAQLEHSLRTPNRTGKWFFDDNEAHPLK